MSKLRVSGFSMSVDGYSAGPNQSLKNPLGEGGATLHEWFYPTATFQQMNGNETGMTGIDNDFAARCDQKDLIAEAPGYLVSDAPRPWTVRAAPPMIAARCRHSERK